MSPQDPSIAPPPPKKEDVFERLKQLKGKRVEKSKPMSVTGFGENLLQNAWDITKGFVNMFPAAVKSAGEVFGDPEGLALLAENPEHLVRAFRDTGKSIADAMVAPYEKHGARVLYEEPLTPVLDAMTILSLGGGAIARTGRLAGSARMADVGTKIASIPERIAAGMLKAPMKAVGINPETRTGFLRIRRHEKAGAELEAGVWKKRIVEAARDLSDEDWATVEKFVLDGGKRAELLANPRAAAVYRELDTWLKGAREAELGEKGRLLLTDEQMQNRVIGELAERLRMDFKGAAEVYKGLEVKPLYAPAIKEVGEHSNWYNAFSPSVIKKGKVGFLEKWASSLGAAPIKSRLMHAVDDFYKTRANLRLMDRVIQTPGWARAVKSGEVTLKELLPSGGIYQKYWTEGPAGRSRARSLFISELEGAHGKERAAQLLRSDVATQKAMAQAVNISIPDKTLRGLIAREFRATGGDWGNFLRVYDRITDLFRFSATKLSPRWYTGNVLGDALLSSMAGSNWPLAKRLIEQHILPRTLRAGKFGLGAETGNRLNSLSDMVGAIDDAARAGIFSKAISNKMRSSLLHFGASEESLRVAIAEVSLAPDELADLMVRNQQLGEHAARNVRQIVVLDKKIVEARNAVNASLGEDAKIQARMMEPAVKGKEQRFAEVVGEAGRMELPAIAKLREKIKANEAAATGLRAENERLVFLRNETREFQRELNWLKGKHPRTPDENVQLITLRQNAKEVAKEAAELEKSVAKKFKIRDENAKLKRQLELYEQPKPAMPPAQEAPKIALQQGEAVEIQKRVTPRTEEAQAALDSLLNLRETMVADLTRNMRARDIARVPELARKAEIAEQAMDRANTFLGEYLGLGPIERGVFRRFIPFYPWVKAMSKLAFTFPFIAPAKAFFWHRYAAAMTEMMGDPELPEWLAPYAPVFMRQNGDTVWARLSSMSPFGSLRTEHIGQTPVPSIVAFWQSNPWVSLTFKLAGGNDVFSQGSIPYGEHLVAINDGETYKFNERGKLEKVIVQPPLIRTAAHVFPVVQMIDQLISNYDVRKGSPVLNSDGTVKYPIDLMYRLADAAGLKLMDRKREDVIRSEKLRVRKALEDLKKQYKKAGPEDREYIKGVFDDFANGEYRRIEANR